MMRIDEKTKKKLEVLRDNYGFNSLDDTLEFVLNETKVVYDRIMDWLSEIVPYNSTSKYIQIVDNSELEQWIFKIFTNQNYYSIHVRKDGTYMGAYLGTRYFRPGEDWTRGNDLPDGPFSRGTWEKIKCAIIRCELEELSPVILEEKKKDKI